MFCSSLCGGGGGGGGGDDDDDNNNNNNNINDVVRLTTVGSLLQS